MDDKDFSNNSTTPPKPAMSSNKQSPRTQSKEDSPALELEALNQRRPRSIPPTDSIVQDSDFSSATNWAPRTNEKFSNYGIELANDNLATEDQPPTLGERLRQTTALPQSNELGSVSLLQRFGYLLNSILALGALGLIGIGLLIQITGGSIHLRATTLKEFQAHLLGQGFQEITSKNVALLSARSIVYPLKGPNGEESNALIIFGEIANTSEQKSPPLSLKLEITPPGEPALSHTIPLGFSVESIPLEASTTPISYRERLAKFIKRPDAGIVQAATQLPYGFVLFNLPPGAESWPYDISLQPWAIQSID